MLEQNGFLRDAIDAALIVIFIILIHLLTHITPIGGRPSQLTRYISQTMQQWQQTPIADNAYLPLQYHQQQQNSTHPSAAHGSNEYALA